MVTLYFLINVLIKIGNDMMFAVEQDNYTMGTEFWLSCLVILCFLQSIMKVPEFIKNIKKLDARASKGTIKSLEISKSLQRKKIEKDNV